MPYFFYLNKIPDLFVSHQMMSSAGVYQSVTLFLLQNLIRSYSPCGKDRGSDVQSLFYSLTVNIFKSMKITLEIRTIKVLTLNRHPRFQFKIFIDRIHRKIFRGGKNRSDTIFMKFFYHQSFFKSKFFSNGFNINIFQRHCFSFCH